MIGIIILNYNTWEETLDCVDSIRKHNTLPYKVYIVDNDSKDASVLNLKRSFANADDVVLLINNENIGYSAGNNIGLRQAEKDNCEYAFIVNSDVEIMNDAFRIMVNTLRKDKSYMMIGPSVLDKNRRESQCPRCLLTPSLFLYERHPLCLIPFFKKKANRIVETTENPTVFDGSVSGCCFGIRIQDFKRMDYFDEKVFLYYEEDILGYKMQSVGGRAVYERDAIVMHKANVSTNKEGNAFVQFHRWTSVLYMLKKYAHISKMQQLGIAIWNIITWDVLSVFSREHRKIRRSFKDKNLTIVRE